MSLFNQWLSHAQERWANYTTEEVSTMKLPSAIVRTACIKGNFSLSKAVGLIIACASSSAIAQGLPPVQFPAENQFSVEKNILGKVLFWDEQLSSDNTMSCGTCHINSENGADPRIGVNPGFDLTFGTADDIIGSPGVSTMDSDDKYLKSVLYDLLPQTTGRLAQPSVMAMFANELFWDGRATSEFVDPETGSVVIVTGGALESQAVGPILSNVEMAHDGRDWNHVISKLNRARPLALASDLTPDMNAIIATEISYPELFELAFGDDQITAARIGMAIATYERTLLPDQTPWDEFVAGNAAALTPQQQAGLTALQGSRCVTCHAGPRFTNNSFRNVGLRPPFEDQGRFEVTGNNGDRGRFKVPSLRNVSLRDRFMHNGQLSTIDDVFDFYARRNGQQSFPQNRDPLLNTPIAFPPNVQNNIENFLINGLTDSRVANEEFPFDRPMLLSEQALDNPQLISSGIAGSGGSTPQMIALSPPNIGNSDFKVGVDNSLGGSQAWLVISQSPPVNGLLSNDEVVGPITLEGVGASEGYGTMHYPIPDIVSLDGQIRYMQWIVSDAQAPGGIAASEVAQLALFCTMHGTCRDNCPADLTNDGDLNFFDVSAFLTAFSSNDSAADFDGNGNFNFFDVSAFLTAFSAGCP